MHTNDSGPSFDEYSKTFFRNHCRLCVGPRIRLVENLVASAEIGENVEELSSVKLSQEDESR